MKTMFIACLQCIITPVMAQKNSTGIFEKSTDVGDAFQYAWKKIKASSPSRQEIKNILL